MNCLILLVVQQTIDLVCCIKNPFLVQISRLVESCFLALNNFLKPKRIYSSFILFGFFYLCLYINLFLFYNFLLCREAFILKGITIRGLYRTGRCSFLYINSQKGSVFL